MILPPGFFLLILGFAGLIFMYKRKFWPTLVALGVGISLYILSAGPVPRLLMASLESDFYHITSPPEGDVIVLLGGGIVDTAPDLSGVGVPTTMMMARVVSAVRLHRRLQIPIIVTGGTVFEVNKQTEATIVKRIMVDLGVPEEQIFEEGKARDTVENARYSGEICKTRGYTHPILVTSAYHLRRSLQAFEMAGMHPSPFPAYFLVEKTTTFSWNQLLPDSATLDLSARALKEYLGLLYYQFLK